MPWPAPRLAPVTTATPFFMYLPFVTARRLDSRCEHTRATVLYERQFELAGRSRSYWNLSQNCLRRTVRPHRLLSVESPRTHPVLAAPPLRDLVMDRCTGSARWEDAWSVRSLPLGQAILALARPLSEVATGLSAARRAKKRSALR